jgi:hypothetical protein
VVLVVVAVGAGGCGRKRAHDAAAPAARAVNAPGQPQGPPAPPPEPPRWAGMKPPGKGEVLALFPDRAAVMPAAEARAAGLMVIDLGDDWAPFIFSDSDTPVDDAAAAPARPATGDGKITEAPASGDAGAGGTDEPVVKPNPYRRTFVDLANDRVDPEDLFLAGGATRELDMSPEAEERRKREARLRRLGKRVPPEPPRAPPRKHTEPVHNHLEVFGIPPTLSVLARRIEHDAQATCFATLDHEGLQRFSGLVTYQNAKQARRDHDEVDADHAWLLQRLTQLGDAGVAGVPDGGAVAAVDAGAVPWAELQLAPPADGVLEQLRAAPRDAARLDRLLRGQVRRRAIRAVQARLVCEGLLSSKSRFVEGMFDLSTHEALAAWERRNDIFGWGFLGDETLATLQRPPPDLHLDTFKRILTERLADQAGIIEDGSVGTRKRAATYRDAEGKRRPVPNLIDEHLQALLAALQIRSADDVALLLRTLGRKGLRALRVAFTPPALPPYYADHMELEVEIDRGRHLVRLSLRPARADRRAEARALPHPHPVDHLERAAHSAGALAHHHRIVAERAAPGRVRLLQVQELGRGAAHLEAGGGGAGVGPTRQHARARPAHTARSSTSARARCRW